MLKYLTIFLLLFSLITSNVSAQENTASCSDRYLTLINPVRKRDLWKDKSLKPLTDQYEVIKNNNFPATWLIQYDVLSDAGLLKQLKSFDSQQEIGVFMEVTEPYAENSRVAYPHSVPWYRPNAVFLSAYTQSERIKLIDTLFKDFKKEFGFYPKSVGAWWIDSYSLSYLKQEYGITSALIVADQKTTDNYGVWGQWWSVPYYPSKANILVPASNRENKENIVILQWAQRHPDLAFGEGYKSSYSLQANDYSLLDKDTAFFKDLVNTYLSCQNPLGQITVGIETGMESISFIEEYQKQLEYLKTRPGINPVTMQDFSNEYARVYPEIPEKAVISSNDSTWYMDSQKRENKKFNETIIYNQKGAFKDYFVPDKEEFLRRDLTNTEYNNADDYNFLVILLFLIICGFYWWKRKLILWASSAIFIFSSFGLLLKSHYQYGNKVYYGTQVEYLLITKLVVVLVSFFIHWFIWQKLFPRFKNLLAFIPLSFAVDPVIAALRISWISEKFYLGFALDPLRFIGLTLSSPFNIAFVNIDFPSYLAVGLLRFNFDNVWDNWLISLIVYPLVHLILGLFIILILSKLPKRPRILLIIILAILLSLHLVSIINSDPRIALPV